MIIPGFSSYDIDENGVITNIQTGAVLKNNTSLKYVTIRITDDNGRRCTRTVHSLVADAFGVKAGPTDVIAFKDGDTRNVALSNLESISRSDLAKRNYNKSQKKRPNKCNTPDSRELIVDAMSVMDRPVTMCYLAGVLCVPYSTVRYSLKQLIEDGVVEQLPRGYVLK